MWKHTHSVSPISSSGFINKSCFPSVWVNAEQSDSSWTTWRHYLRRMAHLRGRSRHYDACFCSRSASEVPEYLKRLLGSRKTILVELHERHKLGLVTFLSVLPVNCLFLPASVVLVVPLCPSHVSPLSLLCLLSYSFHWQTTLLSLL